MSDTIVLNGLAWDTENLEVNGKTYFTYEEAKSEAAKLCKRLPTKNEFEALLQLPRVFDYEKRGIWFAKNQEDLKSDKSLFLPAAGYRNLGSTTMNRVGTNGFYWSATPNGTAGACNLYFSSTGAGTDTNYRNYGFSVRCVSDINKSEVMETNQEIEFKIPEGYVIDNSKSTKDKIVCKPIEPKYPKSWEEQFQYGVINGYYIEGCSIERASHDRCSIEDKGTFKTKKQAESALAYAQLTQLMALPCYNGDWTPNLDDPYQERYCITRMKYDIVKLDYSGYFSFLAFKSEKVRDEFFNNHMDLIRQFHQL